ncbi:Small RNA 2'-O-methyltransferase [Liparis tanakae]|uniref:Small RNA 2'-O-methyltransferase n=1 Tax=Liparis tanakae TaxID=230148 RepID=A0A4Z2F1K0_9TELE|nr:Small RNA 2'-O-methyltransferase [Liparis tanakae]
MDPIFSPPLHQQRHQFVIDFVKRSKPQKVLDLGCSECSLLKLLKFHQEIELLVGMDIDGAKLKKKMFGLAPMLTDYLQPSDRQLRIELYEGSVTQRDARLRGFDLVTSIELIEHLTLPDVKRFSDVVFGYLAPGAVIVSTPNCEYNPLFPGNIGVFHRLGGKGNNNNNKVLFCEEAEGELPYTLLYSKNYPSLQDNNILTQVLVTEVLSGADKLRRRWAEEEETGRRETGRWDSGGDPPRNTDGDQEEEEEEEECHLGMERNPRAMRILVQREEVEDRKLFWKDGQEQQESCKVHRCVRVPLVLLWSRYPKVRVLAGSIDNLQQHLRGHPDVTLSRDGMAVLLNDQERGTKEEEEEEEERDDLDDSGYAEVRRCSRSVEPEEDWDADA